MRDFDAAKELFKDTINTDYYFDSISAEIARNKIEEAIKERNAPLIFVIGDPGVGKSYILRVINSIISQSQLTVFIDHPFFDKRDLLKMLYDAKELPFDKDINFNTLKDELLKAYEGTNHTIFIDEAQLLNEEQFELIRIMSDTKVFQFVLSMHKEEGAVILQKKHFKSRTKIVIEYGNLEETEILRYIQSSLVAHTHGEIASMFSKNEAKTIGRYAKGNFRTIKKFLYILMKLLSYAKKHGLTKHQKINSCLLTMAALDIGLINDK
ncbi:MAG: ATP-binding protein [Sulfurospirillaceae bacterium]|nr:ATP-binding protein [Sulfurospirillaceae bacterium]